MPGALTCSSLGSQAFLSEQSLHMGIQPQERVDGCLCALGLFCTIEPTLGLGHHREKVWLTQGGKSPPSDGKSPWLQGGFTVGCRWLKLGARCVEQQVLGNRRERSES